MAAKSAHVIFLLEQCVSNSLCLLLFQSVVLATFIENDLSICSLQFPQPEEAQCLYAAVDEAIEASSVAQGVQIVDPQG